MPADLRTDRSEDGCSRPTKQSVERLRKLGDNALNLPSLRHATRLGMRAPANGSTRLVCSTPKFSITIKSTPSAAYSSADSACSTKSQHRRIRSTFGGSASRAASNTGRKIQATRLYGLNSPLRSAPIFARTSSSITGSRQASKAFTAFLRSAAPSRARARAEPLATATS